MTDLLDEYRRVKKHAFLGILNCVGIDFRVGHPVCSPFRDDKKPSFHIYEDGAHDYATGETFDSADIVAKTFSCSNIDAMKCVVNFANTGRFCVGESAYTVHHNFKPTMKKKIDGKRVAVTLPLEIGSPDFEQCVDLLSKNRHVSKKSIMWAVDRGFVSFGKYAVVEEKDQDNEEEIMRLINRNHEMFGFHWFLHGSDIQSRRRVDGGKMRVKSGEAKSVMSPGSKNRFVGFESMESSDVVLNPFYCQKIVIAEGAPDYLSLIDFILTENIFGYYPVCAVTGNSTFSEAEINTMKEKHCVVIIAHPGETGMKSALKWSAALAGSETQVKIIHLTENDLNDQFKNGTMKVNGDWISA